MRVEGEFLKVKRARFAADGGKKSWLEVVLDEGKNRHILRLLAELRVNVLRLVRVSIGPLEIGRFSKGRGEAAVGSRGALDHPVAPLRRGQDQTSNSKHQTSDKTSNLKLQ